MCFYSDVKQLWFLTSQTFSVFWGQTNIISYFVGRFSVFWGQTTTISCFTHIFAVFWGQTNMVSYFVSIFIVFWGQTNMVSFFSDEVYRQGDFFSWSKMWQIEC